MNWEAISAIGEMLGAGGVIVSLIYLASQIRHNTIALKTESALKAAESMRAINASFLQSTELSGLASRGLENPSGLTVNERDWLVNAMFNLLRQWETVHFQFINGHVDRQVFESYEKLLSHYMASPFLREYWALRQTLYTLRFVAYVNGLETGEEAKLRFQQVVDRLSDVGK